MAKTDRICPQCQRSIITFVDRNRAEVERRADYQVARGFVCEDCMVVNREEGSQKAAEQNAAAGLPALRGTKKQAAWAEAIRAELLGIADDLAAATRALQAGDVELARDHYRRLPVIWQPKGVEFEALGISHNDKEAVPAATLALCEVMRDQADAGWWIDHRGASFAGMLSALHQAVADSLAGAPSHDELQDEVAVKPESQVTDAVADIDVSASSVAARLPEKNDAFRTVVRELGYRWDSDDRQWVMAVGVTQGTTEDRAAELAHALLGAGFIVACQRAAVRDMAMAGTFEPIYPRWMAMITTGYFKGWVRLVVRDDLSIAGEVEHLHGRKDFYREGVWYVRPGQYEALLDMADIHGFKLTEGAWGLLKQAQQRDEASLLAQDLPAAPKASAKENPVGREVPGGIDEGLRDD